MSFKIAIVYYQGHLASNSQYGRVCTKQLCNTGAVAIASYRKSWLLSLYMHLLSTCSLFSTEFESFLFRPF